MGNNFYDNEKHRAERHLASITALLGSTAAVLIVLTIAIFTLY